MYQAPHEVRDQTKLAQMIALLSAGGRLPAILVCGDRALSGTHRLAAWAAAGVEPEVTQVSDADIAAAMDSCGLDPLYDSISDFGQIESALIAMGY